MHHQHNFSDNLRLITAPRNGTEAVTLLVLTGAGSRNECENERGISHFLEHMFFKGGKKFQSAKQVAEAIDSVGGDFNAFTGKEYAGYYVKTAAENAKVAFDVLSDMLLHATFPQNEIEKERGVILQEYNMYEDTPMYKIGWDFEELLFSNDHPMGWDQIGTKKLITTVNQDDFQAYKASLYTPDNTVIIAAGNIEKEAAKDLTEKYFIFDKTSQSRHHIPFIWSEKNKRIHIRDKKTEQAHLVMGYPGLPMEHKDEYVMQLLAVILGGNMSSRMFLNIREAHGLCYSISTSTDRYTDCGVISTHAGVDIPRAEKAIIAIKREYERMTEEKVSDQELQKAKNFLKGKITLRMEDSEQIASFFGTQALLRSEVKTLDDVFNAVNSVTADDIFRVAQELFVPAKLSLAMIGPFSGQEEKFEALLRD